jgi:hypothetical protein
MASDGLIFRWLAVVHPKYQVQYLFYNIGPWRQKQTADLLSLSHIAEIEKY